MAAPVIESFSTASSGANSFSINKPSGTQEGDVLLLLYHQAATAVSALASDGFTNVGLQWGVSWGARGYALWKVAGSSEPSSYTVTATGGAGSTTAVVMLRISGADASTPINAITFTNGNFNQTASLICPSLTTTVDDCLFVGVGTSPSAVGATYTPPSGATLINLGLPFPTMGVIHEALGNAGSTGTRTITRNTSSYWSTLSIAIAPAAGGGGGFQAAWAANSNIILGAAAP